MQKFIYCSVIFLFVFSFFTGSTAAQQWSDTQKEVWSSIEKYWTLDDSKDLNGFLEYFDESYKGWSYDTEKPLNKTEVRKEISAQYEKEKDITTKTTLTPLEIWVKGDLAYVHYNFTRVKTTEGKSETASGRWTDILQKKGDKWVLVGDHGGSVTKK